MSYWIKTVAEMTDIPKNTLIAWERRYGFVQPRRTDSGYRVYSDADVDLLRRAKELLDGGYRISEVVGLLTRKTSPPVQLGSGPEWEPGMTKIRVALLRALLVFDSAAADRLLHHLVAVPLETRLDQIYMPLIQETGRLWEEGEATIVQEHFISAWCREQILAMSRVVEPTAPHAPEAICATPAGEPHEFGLLGAAFRLANVGYRVLYLGVDVPVEQLLSLVARRKPAIVAVSVVWLEGFDALDFGARVLSQMGPRGRVLIAGRAVEGLGPQSTDRLLLGVPATRFMGRG
jgi:DNA-binding transcriptional MerR regulator